MFGSDKRFGELWTSSFSQVPLLWGYDEYNWKCDGVLGAPSKSPSNIFCKKYEKSKISRISSFFLWFSSQDFSRAGIWTWASAGISYVRATPLKSVLSCHFQWKWHDSTDLRGGGTDIIMSHPLVPFVFLRNRGSFRPPKAAEKFLRLGGQFAVGKCRFLH